MQTASDERRRDLAELLRTGLSKSDAELVEHESLLKLLGRLNDAQVLILMRYRLAMNAGFGDKDLEAFVTAQPAVFDVMPPSMDAGSEERRRWTMYRYYEDELMSLGLLRDTEGGAKSPIPRLAITHLGQLLLAAIGREP